MKIQSFLDYRTILANQSCPVHLALHFVAPEDGTRRKVPAAFCVVLDRSGSMGGAPIEAAKQAVRQVVRNLRKNDLFSLVVFDSEAQVVLPLEAARSKAIKIARIGEIQTGDTTNLAAGWMLGRDELKKAPAGVSRRLLLLSDGLLNVGITEPAQVRRLVQAGLEGDHVTTSCLGFGEGYHEDLMAELATATQGNFYDANSPEKLPAIFSSELQGLQALAVQNLRVRVRKLDFCESWTTLSAYPEVDLPDGRREIAIGSLVSEEERTLVLAMEVLPVPLLTGGQPAADLEGERLIELEVLYDEVSTETFASHSWRQVIRVLPVQDAKDLKMNEEAIPWISTQQAGRAMEEALRELDDGKWDVALQRLKRAIEGLVRYGSTSATADGLRLLRNFTARVEESGGISARARKSARYQSRHFRKMSSHQLWTQDEAPPSYSQPPKPEPAPPEPGDGP